VGFLSWCAGHAAGPPDDPVALVLLVATAGVFSTLIGSGRPRCLGSR